MKNYLSTDKPMYFVFPIDGDCLSSADGREENGLLYVECVVKSDNVITVNGAEVSPENGVCKITLPLSCGENILTAKSGEEEISIKTYRLPKARGFCRISVDDNIIFLWDITKNKDKYTSIFDNPYLSVYKKAHDLYGVCVHLNLFYQMPLLSPGFSEEREEFNLSQVTDKFKDEWIANSHWLKLNFHSLQELPDKPYIDTDYQTIWEHCKMIQKEIIRFAGKETLSEETTVHFGECTKEGVKALYDCNIKSLGGYFTFFEDEPFVSYFYPKDLVKHIEDRDFWIDTELDMFYGKIDFVLNTHEVKHNYLSLLEELKTKKTRCGYVELMIHEQYYYKDYCNYIPTFEKIITESAKWLCDNGYKPAFLDEIRKISM